MPGSYTSGTQWIGCRIPAARPTAQRRLGWTPPNAGTVKVLSKAKRFTESWKTTLGSYWKESLAEPMTPSTNRNNCKHAVARSKEPCFPSSWVFFERTKGEVKTGSIGKIMIPEGSLLNQGALLTGNTLELFLVSNVNHDRLKIPHLLNTGETVLVKPESLRGRAKSDWNLN
ncbi:hypothetical protein B0H14DRAFT_2571385 [Mycena olivaceomarginata]|nr:hypothetical protein B0H14DRAFT_2571385 [Mycena olivaceomarginata]